MLRASSVLITEEGVVGPTVWGKRGTLRWEEIQDVRLVHWSVPDEHLYHFNILPKLDGKRKIFVSVELEQVGETINLIKEKAGLLPAIPDLGRFLTEPRSYGHHSARVWMTVVGYTVLGLLIIAPLPVICEYLSSVVMRRRDMWMTIILVLTLLFWMALIPLWRSLQRLGVRLSVDGGGLTQYRGTRVVQRIAWSELGKVNMLWDRSVLTTRGGRSLTVFRNLPRFDEFNQIIRLQKERLRL